jgi:hypothetical protein
MNTTDLTTAPTVPHRGLAAAGCTVFTATISGTAQLVRAVPVWPIDEVLAIEDQLLAPDSPDHAAGMPLDAALMHDLTESRLIAPLRSRRRRDRGVSSRAALLQATR